MITSRSAAAAERLAGPDAIYNVPTRGTTQAVQFVQNKLKDECAGDDKVIRDLLEALEYMPLAIYQAVAYIKQRRPHMSVTA